MNESIEPAHHVFEDYPRRTLSDGVTRRQFLGAIFTEFHLAARQDDGYQVAKVKDLGTMADEDLKWFIPTVVEGAQINMRENAVWGQPPGFTHPVRLFALEGLTTFVFNQINGENTLEYIAYQMAVHLGWPSARAFAFTRGMFLTLVDLRVVAPKNPPLGPG